MRAYSPLILFVFLAALWPASALPNGWRVHPVVKSEAESGRHETLLAEKYFHAPEGSFPLGQILSISSPGGGQSFQTWSDDFIKTVQKGFKSASWKKRKFKKAIVIEGAWEKGNRFYKYFIWQKNGRFHYSMASSRISYADKFYYDSEIYQRLLYFKSDKISNVKTVLNRLQNFLMATAHAQANCNCAPADYMCQLLCAGVSDPDSESNFDFNALLSEITTLRGDVNVQWGESNEQWAHSNKNWEENNRQMDMYRQMINTNWQESNEIMDQRWAETNQVIEEQWSETNAIAREGMERSMMVMEKAMDPKHMFKLAMATGAGAAVGSTAVGLAVDGIAFGLKKLVSLFQSDLSDKEKLELFQSAIENYEKNNQVLKKLENALDTLPLMMITSKALGAGFNEDKLFQMRELEKEKRHLLRRSNSLNGAIDNIDGSDMRENEKYRCIDSLYDRQLDMEKEIGDIEKILAFLENNQNIEDSFCASMQNLWRQYLNAEMAMTRLRRILSTPDLQDNFLKAIDEQFNQTRERNEDVADEDAGEDVAKSVAKRAQSSRKKALIQLEAAQRQLLGQCSRAITSNIRLYRQKRTDRRRSQAVIRDHCEKLFTDYYNLESRQRILGQSHQEAYRHFLDELYPGMEEESKTEIVGELHDELNILGRLENFEKWNEEIDAAYERKVESAGSYEEFMRPFKADLIRIDENLLAYQVEAYLDWFEQVAKDLDEKEKNLGAKMNDRADLLEKICPATHYRWSSHLPN